MIINIITLFPGFFKSPLETGLLGKAINSKIITINLVDLRLFSENKHNRCDDYSYGGGSGMVLKPAPMIKAIKSVKKNEILTLLTTPVGKMLNQNTVKELSRQKEFTIVCGHYEGVDQRVIDRHIDIEISIGDYILSGGEFASLVIVDSIARYVPGFMSNKESLVEESFENDLLEYPQYTRPDNFEDMKVPDILLSGNHSEIEKWRLEKSIEKTKKIRPDLYKKYLNRINKGDK